MVVIVQKYVFPTVPEVEKSLCCVKPRAYRGPIEPIDYTRLDWGARRALCVSHET